MSKLGTASPKYGHGQCRQCGEWFKLKQSGRLPKHDEIVGRWGDPRSIKRILCTGTDSTPQQVWQYDAALERAKSNR